MELIQLESTLPLCNPNSNAEPFRAFISLGMEAPDEGYVGSTEYERCDGEKFLYTFTPTQHPKMTKTSKADYFVSSSSSKA